MRGLSDGERALMAHVSMWGADGYPVYKCGSHHWTWGTASVVGPPVVFPTKQQAVASFEAFRAMLRDAIAGRI